MTDPRTPPRGRNPLTGALTDSQDATTPTTWNDDGKFIRTALVVKPSEDCGSIDLVDSDGNRLAQVNIFTYDNPEGPALIVDVIDTEDLYRERRLLHFANGDRHIVEMGNGTVASVDFR